MGVSQFIAISLRVCELAFSAVVAGITGSYLNQANIKQASSFSKRDFICTEVVAGLGIFFALLFLLPIRWSFVVDFILFILWMVAFGLLADFIVPLHCGSVFNWYGITGRSTCSKFKADIAFCFLASIFFFVSGLLGIYIWNKKRKAVVVATEGAAVNKRWYKRRANAQRV